MKKIISLLLACTLLIGAASALTACGGGKESNPKNYKTGTEAAKLLLANTRFDEKSISKKLDIGLGGGAHALSLRTLSSTLSLGGGDNFVIWDDFPAHNESMSQFDSFIENIDNYAIDAAKQITHMKDNLGIVDNWVGDESYKQLLSVTESRDTLLTVQSDAQEVYHRYTDENANNIYELYSSFVAEESGESGESKMLLIPGERYENFYNHSSGFTDYVIIENTRGYWMLNRFSYSKITEDGTEMINFFPAVIRDGLCYMAWLSASTHPGLSSDLHVDSFSVVDVATGRELLRVQPDNGATVFHLPFSAIKQGFLSVGSDDHFYNEDIGYYYTGLLRELNLVSGTIASRDRGDLAEGEIGFTGGFVSYDHQREIHHGSITLTHKREGFSLSDSMHALNGFLTANGVTLYRSTADIHEALNHAQLLGEDFGKSFSWYGHNAATIEGMKLARAELDAELKSAWKLISDRKNLPVTAPVATEDKPLLPSFAPLSVTLGGDSRYENGEIHVASVSASLTETLLLEEGKSYVLKLALSMLDASGNPIPVNTLPLASGNAVAFAKDGISLTASGTLTVPKNLSQGNYAVVVYAATKDEGIRVSELVKIGRFSPATETLESEAMDIAISANENGCAVKYTVKNVLTLNVAATKASYSYDEIYRILMLEVIKKGTPKLDAAVTLADGSAVALDASLGKGSYRITCYLPTADGLAESYVYLNLN